MLEQLTGRLWINNTHIFSVLEDCLYNDVPLLKDRNDTVLD